MIIVEPIQDMKLVRETFTQPHVWAAMSDDGFIDPCDFWPVPRPGTYYLGAWDGDEYLGMFMVYTVNAIMCDAHIAMLKTCGGLRAHRSGKLVIEWIWRNTMFRRIITSVPECNTLGLRFAKLAGLSQFGLNPGSWLKNGQLHDQIELGVSHGWRGNAG